MELNCQPEGNGTNGTTACKVRLAVLENKVADMKECQEEFKTELTGIKTMLTTWKTESDKKPSWFVTALITCMLSTLVGLLVYLAQAG